ncbi:hypothetical protein QJS66_21180 [Kocuria rhizophila]|nr:hypothetical protein QJS66_21180 [Kocuria rhizophila]
MLAHLYQQRLSADGVPATAGRWTSGSTREEIFDALQDGRATSGPGLHGQPLRLRAAARSAASQATGASPTRRHQRIREGTDAPRRLLDSLGSCWGSQGSRAVRGRRLPGPAGRDAQRSGGAEDPPAPSARTRWWSPPPRTRSTTSRPGRRGRAVRRASPWGCPPTMRTAPGGARPEGVLRRPQGRARVQDHRRAA